MVIGYTTGVFDLFHIGHLNILKKAKEHCDYLIVGVTTDETALSLKKRYPAIPYAERQEIVKSIRYVDEVVPEVDTDKLKAWKEHKFNVIFKGSDWQNTDLWKHYESEFNKVNVKIIFFKYTEGTSSTLIHDYLESNI